MDNSIKTHYGVRIFGVIADYLITHIIRINDQWPRSFSEWRRVCDYIEYEILLVRDAPEIKSCCLFAERVILIQPVLCPVDFHRQCAHEVAHAMIDVGAPDGDILYWPRDPDECHLVARLVESYVDAKAVRRDYIRTNR